MDINNLSKFIKYLEISSFFHDIGKISSHFLLSKDKDLNIKDQHAILILEDKLPDNVNKFLKEPLYKKFPNFKDLLEELSPINLICSHHGCQRCKYSNGCKKFEKNFFVKILQVSDRLDSSNPPNSGKQPFYSVYISDFFANYKKLDFEKIDQLRIRFLNFLDLYISNFNRDKIYKISKIFMENALSETRRGANDINLYTHSKATSSIFKTILFDCFYFGIEPPISIFDVEFKFLKTKAGFKNLIEDELSFGNLIFEFEDYEFYIVGKGVDKLFLKINGIEGIFVNDINIEKSKRKYFYPLNPEKILKTIFVKIPEDIDLNFDEIVKGTLEIVNYGRYSEYKDLKEKIKGVKKHIRNLKKGNKIKEIEYKIKELKKLDARFKYLKKLENKNFNLNNIEKFLMKTLAPIRPPSVSKFSQYILGLMKNKKLNVNELAFEVFLKKPLTMSRLIQYNNDLIKYKDIKEIPKFIGKVKYSQSIPQEKYYEIEEILNSDEFVTIKLKNDKILKIPITYDGKEIDKLNLYFIGNIKRKGELIFPIGKNRSLIHVTKLEKGDRIKLMI
ncbi:MAG: hypothetical protein N3D74_00430 [Caldisericia bacterium]|nr:hypothetical protein [Caldisericia bacterium]